MRFDFYSSLWSQLMLCSEQFRVKLAARTRSNQVRKSKTDILFVAAVAALASCTPPADVRETNRGESVSAALSER